MVLSCHIRPIYNGKIQNILLWGPGLCSALSRPSPTSRERFQLGCEDGSGAAGQVRDRDKCYCSQGQEFWTSNDSMAEIWREAPSVQVNQEKRGKGLQLEQELLLREAPGEPSGREQGLS